MSRDIWAVVPVKETAAAKQRLAEMLPPSLRRELALAMLRDVLSALAAVPTLAGIITVTDDDEAAKIAASFGARIQREGAGDGHSGAVTAAARLLARDQQGLLTVPADIPLVQPEDIAQVLATATAPPCFTIVPAWNELGSNAVLMAPADAVPLRFGQASFHPHLAAARLRGIEPHVLHLPRIALDIDEPADLLAFLRNPSHTHARSLLERMGVAAETAAS